MADELKGADEKLLETAKKRFREAAEAETEIRRLSLEDKKFAAGEQWDEAIEAARKLDGRPCLTVNKIPQFTQQVTNDQRQNRPAIKVNPVDDGGDVKTAGVIQGLIRHIEYASGADAAYDWAFEDAVVGGYGYVRVLTDYADTLGFDQEIQIDRVKNPFSVYVDPSVQKPDYSDANYMFVETKYSKEAFKTAYPDAALNGSDWRGEGDGWLSPDECRVCEYFYKEQVKKTIVLMSDGTIHLKDEMPGLETFALKGVTQVNERVTRVPFIKWAKITDGEVLERGEWPGKWIPIVPVLGKELDLDGKKVLKGIVRDSKDPQRQYNFMETAATEMIALAPKAPFIGYAGQFEGFERKWQAANKVNFPYLEVKPVLVQGQIAPLPQRQQAEPPIQAMGEMIAHAADDMKSTTGIFDASLGARSNETSGAGIRARQSQSQSGNFHYVDNLTRTLRHLGLILIDLIPKVYDAKRVVRIIGDDGTQSTVTVNNKPPAGQGLPPGVANIYDLSVGKYDVTVSAGPSYQTKRQEAVAGLMNLVSSYPQLMSIAGDLLVKSMDIPDAEAISERIFRSIPPNLTMPEDPMEGVPMEAQQRFSQLMQQLQAANQQLQQLQQEQQSQMAPKMAELESKERIELAKLAAKERDDAARNTIDIQKIQVSLVTAQATIDGKLADRNIQSELAVTQQQLDHAHEAAMLALQAQQQSELQQQQPQTGQQQQQQPGQQQQQSQQPTAQ